MLKKTKNLLPNPCLRHLLRFSTHFCTLGFALNGSRHIPLHRKDLLVWESLFHKLWAKSNESEDQKTRSRSSEDNRNSLTSIPVLLIKVLELKIRVCLSVGFAVSILCLVLFRLFKVLPNMQCNAFHTGSHPDQTENHFSPRSPSKGIFQLSFSSKLVCFAGNNYSLASQPLGCCSLILPSSAQTGQNFLGFHMLQGKDNHNSLNEDILPHSCFSALLECLPRSQFHDHVL